MDDTTKEYYRLTKIQEKARLTCAYINYLKTQIAEHLRGQDKSTVDEALLEIDHSELEELISQK